MKKILTSVVAAAALLFGFASCSGDLHDKVMSVTDLSAGAVPGDYESPANWDNKTKWTSIDAATNTYTLDFVTKADCKGEVGFKILTANGEWNVAGYAAPNKVAAGGEAVFTMISASDMGAAGNATMTGMKPSTGYKLTVVANPDTTVTAKVEETGASAPVPFYLDGYYILGSADIGGNSEWKASVDTLLWNPVKDNDGNLTYSYTFKAGAAEIQFGIGRKGWADCFNNGSEFKYGTDTEPKVLASGNTANNKVSGLTVGDTYIMKVYTTPKKEVSFSLTIPYYLTIEFNVAGFGAENEGKTAILGGGFNNWYGWTSAWGQDKKVSDLPNGEVQADGTAVIVYKVPVQVGDEFKIGEFCGYFGDESDGDIATADGMIKAKAGSYNGNKDNNFYLDYKITVDGTATYVVSGITIGGDSPITCAKK